MKVLGIESSCDETAAAVVEDGRRICSSVIASSVEEQALYGGVVPEIASRRHIESISAVVRMALEEAGLSAGELDAVAVTYAPGLIGALLVGVNFAKGLAFSAGKALVPVHHLRGHVASLYLTHPQLRPPFLCLIASGGHNHIVEVQGYTRFRVLGRTVDDAAGEAFDKVARTLGLGYPGGPAVAKAAEEGDPAAYPLPTPHTQGRYDVSFSGLKTAVLNLANRAQMKGETVNIPGLAASFQNKVTDILSEKLCLAAGETGARAVALAGGVAANIQLREKTQAMARERGIEVFLPETTLCGDNAAMIAAQGYYERQAGHTADATLNGYASLPIEEDGPPQAR
ncbi:tRNA (adenosine(37)-N6)-threonylcarbamoyltransferase complex transferase subunit TsaD [Ruminococcaceae bacterium OttesenSCG-928-I18]|nr:tRNA (adenosine(37)-N6)-threonylcarbamoyltransferase complex transferase subunit TsaD [Ruminococcaceae bacterium OttesenSCG-928-I18]